MTDPWQDQQPSARKRWQYIPDSALRAEEQQSQAEQWAAQQRATLAQQWADNARQQIAATLEEARARFFQPPTPQPLTTEDASRQYATAGVGDVSNAVNQVKQIAEPVGNALEMAGRPQQGLFAEVNEAAQQPPVPISDVPEGPQMPEATGQSLGEALLAGLRGER
ncbi:MAG: hypothetical protein WC718_16430, partial [Phycisphaerales bacterium]